MRSQPPDGYKDHMVHPVDKAKDVAGALARRQELLDAVGEVDQPDAVIVVDGAEGEQGGQFGGDLALGLPAGAEGEAAAGVQEE